MDYSALAMGVVGLAGGIWGIVIDRKVRDNPPEKNPWRYDPPPVPPPYPWAEKLVDQLKAFSFPAIPPVSVEVPEPEWSQHAGFWNKELAKELKLANERIKTLSELLARPLVEVTTLNLTGFEDRMMEVSERLEDAVEPLSNLPEKVTDALEKVSRPVVMVSGGGGGGGAGRPPRALPPPRAAFPPLPPHVPMVPPSYVGGTVIVPSDRPENLLTLIREQLQVNCPATSTELVLSAEDTVLIGASSHAGGAVRDENFAFELSRDGPPRIYRSSFPGHSTPLGDLQVFAPREAALHVEVVI